MAEMSEEGVFVASYGTTKTEDGAETETRSVTFDPSAVPTGTKKRKRAELLKRMQKFIGELFGVFCGVRCLLVVTNPLTAHWRAARRRRGCHFGGCFKLVCVCDPTTQPCGFRLS